MFLTPEPSMMPIDASYTTMDQVLRAYIDGARADSRYGVTVLRGSDEKARLSWPQIARAAFQVGAGLRARGLQPGALVFLAMPNSPDFVVTYCACVLQGYLPCPVPAPHVDDGVLAFQRQIQAAIRHHEPALLVLNGALDGPLDSCGVAVCNSNALRGGGTLDAAELPRQQPDAPLHVQLTSGSTGAPKAAVLSHGAVIANIVLSARAGHVGERGHSGLIWLPLFHDMGLVALLSALYIDSDIVVQQPEDFILNPMGWLQRFSQYRATISAVPTFALAYCVRRFRSDLLKGVDLSSIVHLVVGAERVHYETLRTFCDTFAPYGFNPDAIKPCYGTAELTLAITVPDGRTGNSFGRFIRCDAGQTGAAEPVLSMGRPLEGSRIEIRDPGGQVLADGEVGQIFIASPCLMQGYYRDPQATAAAVVDGFYASGDFGYLREGELFVLGRIKELIILRGRNYFPHEFEDCLVRHPLVDVGRVAALGIPDPRQGSEQLVILVEPEQCGDLTVLSRQLQDLLRKEFGFGAHVLGFVARGAIPRTTSRKIQRLECARLYREGGLPLLTTASAPDVTA